MKLFFKKSQKGYKTLKRAPRKRGGPASKRGLAKEQVCIFTARDRSKHCMESVAGTGPAAGACLTGKIAPIIAEDSVVVSDASASYQLLVSHEKIKHIIVKNNPESERSELVIFSI